MTPDTHPMPTLRDKTCLITALILCPCLCMAKTCQSLDALAWLPGNWQAQQEKTIILETWKKISPTTYEGSGATQARDTHTSKTTEILRLVEMAGEIFYIAKVAHNALPVAFRLSTCSDGHWIFKNAQHDFPKQIEYQLESPQHMTVTVGADGQKSFKLKFKKLSPQTAS